jgi:hypothetical protein
MSEASRSSTVVLCVNGTRHRLRLDHRDRPRCAARAPGPDRDQEGVRPLAVRRVHRAARHLAPYHLPAHADVPAIEIGWIDEHDTQVNPLRVKGIGELGVAGYGRRPRERGLAGNRVSVSALCPSRRIACCREQPGNRRSARDERTCTPERMPKREDERCAPRRVRQPRREAAT